MWLSPRMRGRLASHSHPVFPQLPRDDGGTQPRPFIPTGGQWAEPVLGLPVARGAPECPVYGKLQPQHPTARPLGLPLPTVPLRGSAAPGTPRGPRPSPETEHHLPAVWDGTSC